MCSYLRKVLAKVLESFPSILWLRSRDSVVVLVLQLRYVVCQTMDTLEENGELVFLYQLTDGITHNSHAVYTAQRAGVPQHILNRVAQVPLPPGND